METSKESNKYHINPIQQVTYALKHSVFMFFFYHQEIP